MNVDHRCIDELLAANIDILVKPNIRFQNYFFKWDKISLGLYLNEVNKFKEFIKKNIPYLEALMKIFEINSKDDSLKKILRNKFQLTVDDKFDDRINFTLCIDGLGTTIFYREERIFFSNNDKSSIGKNIKSHISINLYNDDSITIRWKLGELLFNRMKSKK